MLNPQWLRTFAALTKLGNFTRAAERLDLTQAAVSQHLHHLEDALGLLVIRRPRAIELTPAGRALLDYCEAMKQARRRLDARVSGPAEAGEIGLITPESIGLALFPLMLDWQAQHPQWKIRYCFAPDPEVPDAVLTNRYELGIVTSKPDDTRLTASKFMQVPLELVVPAGAEVRAWSDLEALGFIDYPDGRAMANRLLTRRFRKNASIADLPRNGFSNRSHSSSNSWRAGLDSRSFRVMRGQRSRGSTRSKWWSALRPWSSLYGSSIARNGRYPRPARGR
ncbi:protein of unknown function (plasmid) [Caballeronia sp. S22]